MKDPVSSDVAAALRQCRWMIGKGSKSFSLAARIFAPEKRDAAFFLYGWCRHCDDEVDWEGGDELQGTRVRKLESLKKSTRSALSRERQSDPVFIAFQHVARRYNIPEHYPLELLEGMAMDVRRQRYPAFDDLLLYCYRVAGTVGLMMAHVMGVSHLKALKHAADLGIAMQLTNIARDVTEDAVLGRIYLPLSWLEEAGIATEEITAPAKRERLFPVVRRLLAEAGRFYRSGEEGLRYLDFRSACAIAAARFIYAEIGHRILREGARALERRSVVSKWKKLELAGRALHFMLRSVPQRKVHPWSPVAIGSVWTYSGIRDRSLPD